MSSPLLVMPLLMSPSLLSLGWALPLEPLLLLLAWALPLELACLLAAGLAAAWQERTAWLQMQAQLQHCHALL